MSALTLLGATTTLCAACADAHVERAAERDEASERPAQESQAEASLCEEVGGLPIKAEELQPSQRHDYLAIRRVVFSQLTWPPAPSPSDGPEEWALTEFETLAETGRPCASASDDACSEKVGHHPTPSVKTSCAQLCVEWSLVTTRGDEVKRWSRPEEVRALLGEIDNVDEALVLVASEGYQLACPPDGDTSPESDFPAAQTRTEARAVDGGFEVIATRTPDTCPVVVRRITLHVSPAGDVEEIGHEDLPSTICV